MVQVDRKYMFTTTPQIVMITAIVGGDTALFSWVANVGWGRLADLGTRYSIGRLANGTFRSSTEVFGGVAALALAPR
jgi:hypothetical protein